MEILIIVVFAVLLIILTMYISMQKKNSVSDSEIPVIHTSGIFSVIRKSPRENIYDGKPSEDEFTSYINSLELEDIKQKQLISDYKENIEESIILIENSDKIGVQRYLIKPSKDCPFCDDLKKKEYFITREDIYKHPELLPPYYSECKCSLIPESQWEKALDITHFNVNFEENPKLPDWKSVER